MRYLVLDDILAVDLVDDIVAYKNSRPLAYGLVYWDTQENKYVKPGKRGPQAICSKNLQLISEISYPIDS